MFDEPQQRLRNILIGRLESLQRAGLHQLPRPTGRGCLGQPVNAIEQLPRPEAASESAPPAAPFVEITPMAKWNERNATSGSSPVDTPTVGPSSVTTPTLELLEREVASCTRCQELACTRTQTVFGVGSPKARLCFLGEAPGADEDRQGKPFVGRAGQLLDRIIAACNLNRDDVYICNVLKCRPPGNRNPAPEEAANCRGFLERQLALVQPEFICCLGAVAAQNLLSTSVSIGKLRGKLHTYRGAKVVCTYHPAYLLRNPSAKKDTWDDMQYLMRAMGVELPGRPSDER
jgi:DNA polymerase